MEETNTQIAWPSKLKIGAKSKKGILFCTLYGVGLIVRKVKPLLRVRMPILDTSNIFFFICLYKNSLLNLALGICCTNPL